MTASHPDPPSQSTFQALRQLLKSKTGIALSSNKMHMVQARLNKRLRALGILDYGTYLQLLMNEPDSEEWIRFVNAMTTNTTSFFREGHHFDHLVSYFMEHPPAQPKLRVWSAGCSTGEEAYTAAMTLRSAFPDWSIRILATDLDSTVLERARAGVYPLESMEQVPAAWRSFGFLKGRAAMSGQVRVCPEIQHMVEFRRLNFLQDEWPKAESFEVIFCRNTLIYFEKPTQARLVSRFRDCLVSGGLFLLGHSESLFGQDQGFLSIGGTMYQRRQP